MSVQAENVYAVNGLGDLNDFFIETSGNCKIVIHVISHDGQADDVASILIDGNVVSSVISYGDGVSTTKIFVSDIVFSGEHSITITTNSNILRYRVSVNCIDFVDDSYDFEYFTDSGLGASISKNIYIQPYDLVLSVIAANGNTTATSGENLLESRVVGVDPNRVRAASSYSKTGIITWTLSASVNWTIILIKIRGNKYLYGTPIKSSSPVKSGIPVISGTPIKVKK